MEKYQVTKEEEEEEDEEEEDEPVWRRGCDANGVTNGERCVLFVMEKANYTKASELCKQKVGGAGIKIVKARLLQTV